MNNACPSCGTTYQVQHKNIGRHIKCKICGAALFVAEEGLRLDDAPPPAGSEAEPFGELGDATLASGPGRGGRQRRAARDYAASFADSFRQLPDPATWLFGGGVLCVLIFLFMPLIDNAVILSKQANLSAGELRERRLAEQFAKNKEQKKTTPADEEMRNKNRDNWEQERRDLQLTIDESKITNDKWEYWYRWGMLIGFILLALASLGYLRPEQPTIRRVVGAIVLVAMVLLVFILFLGMRGLR